MPEVIHASGLREVVPTKKELERRILDQFGLDAITAILANQRAIAEAFNARRVKKADRLTIEQHPIEAAYESMEQTLKMIADRMGATHA